MKFYRLAIVAFLLTGCASEQKKEAKQQAKWERLMAQDDATCKSYGLQFGTPDYANCRQHIADQRANHHLFGNRSAGVVIQQQQNVTPPTNPSE
jgi:hypothetical protein